MIITELSKNKSELYISKNENQTKNIIKNVNVYNIVTTSTNKVYEKFLILFLNSLFENTDTSKLNKVFILEENIDDTVKEKLINKYEKLKFEKRHYDVNLPKIYSKFKHDWRSAVLLKSIYVYEKVKTSNIPVVLIDLDTFFIKNFDQYIDLTYDLQVCDRGGKDENLQIIASFISFNNKQKSILFLENWMRLIKEINEDVVETKSLNLLCRNPFFKIERLSYKKVGYYYDLNFTNETSLYHLKGTNPLLDPNEDIKNRIERISGKFSVEKYLSL